MENRFGIQRRQADDWPGGETVSNEDILAPAEKPALLFELPLWSKKQNGSVRSSMLLCDLSSLIL